MGMVPNDTACSSLQHNQGTFMNVCVLVAEWLNLRMADEGFEERKGSSGLHMRSGCFYHDWCFGWFVRPGRISTCFNQWSTTAAFGMVMLLTFGEIHPSGCRVISMCTSDISNEDYFRMDVDCLTLCLLLQDSHRVGYNCNPAL